MTVPVGNMKGFGVGEAEEAGVGPISSEQLDENMSDLELPLDIEVVLKLPKKLDSWRLPAQICHCRRGCKGAEEVTGNSDEICWMAQTAYKWRPHVQKF